MTITPVIGLEVHIELKTKSKMFCSCDAEHFHATPNTHTCPVCLGLPGALPVPNKTAIDWCIKLGLALGCTVNKESFFERKNYFYPDLAKSYQISQYLRPFTVNGKLNIDGQEVRVNRVHMEEDTGKSVHQNGDTLLDFNRSGVPLVEIVSEPDISSPEAAKKYLLKIQQIVRYLGISDADIEKGSMRCEPTVNVIIDGVPTPLVEIKNVASLTGVMTAIQFEIDRQVTQYQIDQIAKSDNNKRTFGWDAQKLVTFPQREKEGSADYRYFPEPDIPPFVFTDDQIELIKSTIPELPDQKISKYKSIGLSDYDSTLLADDKTFSECFEKIVGATPSSEFAKFTANLLNSVIRTHLNEAGESIDITKINPAHYCALFENKTRLNSNSVKALALASYTDSAEPIETATAQNLFQVSDTGAIEEIVKQVIADNSKAVEDYKKNPMSIGFLVGQVMKASKGSANPVIAKEILEKLLN